MDSNHIAEQTNSKIEKCSIIATPDNLLKQLKGIEAVKNILERKSLSVLDIGCRNPEYLYVLYHDLNFNILDGIEIISEVEAVKQYLRVAKKEDDIESNSIYDLYLKYLKFDGTELEGRKTHLDKINFIKKFNIYFNTSAYNYFESIKGNKKYDLIIIADVLHLNPRDVSSEILFDAVNSLNEGGLIYVKVNHPENKVAMDNNQNTYTEVEFLELLNDLKPIFSCKNFMEDSEKVRSIVYFGQKNK